MSAQGGTLARGTVHLPIWPVAALVAAAAAVTIGVTMIGGAQQEASRPFTLSGEAANSTTGLREAGVVVPAIPEFDFASTTALRETGIVLPSITALRETGIVLPQVWGVSHVTPSQTAVSTYASGLENPTAYGTGQAGLAPRAEPIMVNDRVCGQCR